VSFFFVEVLELCDQLQGCGFDHARQLGKALREDNLSAMKRRTKSVVKLPYLGQFVGRLSIASSTNNAPRSKRFAVKTALPFILHEITGRYVAQRCAWLCGVARCTEWNIFVKRIFLSDELFSDKDN
jgi:hypothetical protein